MTGTGASGDRPAPPSSSVNASVERSRSRYLLRRAGVVAAVVALVVAGLGLTSGLPTSWEEIAGGDRAGDEPVPSTSATATGSDSPAEADPAGADPAGDESAAAAGPVTSTQPGSLGSPTESSEPGEPEEAAEPATRLVLQTPRRVVDTDDGGEAPLADSLATFTVNGEPAAVLLSVSVIETGRDGSVLADGRAGAVEAIRVPKAGVTTTNLVVVRLDGDEVTVRSSAGGHLTVDVVGGFEPVEGPSADGRLVPVEPQLVGELVTATDGRELEVSLGALVPPASTGLAAAGVSGVLAVITADVGSSGGMVQLGPTAGAYDQALQWSPAVDGNVERRGLVVLRPSGESLASIRYDGGTRLRVEIVGYITNSRAPVDTSGLFVQTGPRILHDGPLAGGTPVSVGGFAADTSWALVTVGPTAGVPGQLGSTVIPVTGGTAAVTAPGDVDAVVTLLAEIR